MRYAVRIGKNGRITIPIEIRRDLGLKTGDVIVFVPTSEGIIIRKATPEEAEAASRPRKSRKRGKSDV